MKDYFYDIDQLYNDLENYIKETEFPTVGFFCLTNNIDLESFLSVIDTTSSFDPLLDLCKEKFNRIYST